MAYAAPPLAIDEYHEPWNKKKDLSDDVVLEIPGMPPFVGIEQAAASMDEFATEILNLVETIAADGDLVFNEPVDYHCDAQGKAHIVVQICSAMEIENGKIARWKEYLEPRPFLEFVQGK